MRIKKIAAISIFSAMALVLHMISFSIVPGFSFLKIDFSCVPIFIITLIHGPLLGIATAFTKNFIHLIISQSFHIGEIFDFFLSSFFIISIQILNKIKKNILFSMIVSSLLTTVVSAFINYFIMLPIYFFTMKIYINNFAKLKITLNLIMPFNLLKFLFLSFISVTLFNRLKFKKLN